MEELGGLAFEQRFLNLISSNSPNDEKFFRKTEGSGSKAHGPISDSRPQRFPTTVRRISVGCNFSLHTVKSSK